MRKGIEGFVSFNFWSRCVASTTLLLLVCQLSHNQMLFLGECTLTLLTFYRFAVIIIHISFALISFKQLPLAGVGYACLVSLSVSSIWEHHKCS